MLLLFGRLLLFIFDKIPRAVHIWGATTIWQVRVNRFIHFLKEMTRKLGFTIQLEEEKLRIQLEALQSQLSAPTQFKGRLNELLSQVRLQSQVNGLGSSDQTSLDHFAR